MKSMNVAEKQINQTIGKTCRIMREEQKPPISQFQLTGLIEDYVWQELRKLGFTESECDAYITSSCDEELCRKLERKHITPNSYHPIAVSTISAYENGETAIPAYYPELLKGIFKSSDRNSYF